MKRFLGTLLLMATVFGLHADIRWLNTDYDFGTWREIQGRRTGIARFVNDGPDSVIITSVRPSCGCTGADWFRDPVAPGDTAWVNFTYDPAGRPGKFEKTVKVYTDPGRVLQVLRICGTIIGKPATVEREFPVAVGDMRLESLRHDFGRTQQGQARHSFIKAYNQTADTIYPRVRIGRGPLEARLAKNWVGPGEMFTVGLFLGTRQLAPGAYSWPVTLLLGDSSATVEVTADIIPEQRQLSADEMAVAAHIAVPSAPVELTPKKVGEKVKFHFKISNSGKTPLKVERIYSRAKAVAVKKYPSTLKPGKEGTVEGTIDLNDVDGPAFGYIIEIISSDPLQPIATVRLTGQMPR